METGSSPLSKGSDVDVGDILKLAPRGRASLLVNRLLSSFPNRCVAKPNWQFSLAKTLMMSSEMTSLLVSRNCDES